VSIFSLALAVVELLAILQFFTKLNKVAKHICHAATWWQKLAGDLPSLPS
jgi:hypothetical protein